MILFITNAPPAQDITPPLLSSNILFPGHFKVYNIQYTFAFNQ